MDPTPAARCYSPHYSDALAWAAELHASHQRKTGPLPYVSHLLAVSVLVWEDGGDEEEATAALLHDAVEDIGGRPLLAEIERRYGPRVAAIVDTCTDSDTEPKPPWRGRKEAHLARLRVASDDGALRVVAGDKLHNATSVLAEHDRVGSGVWDLFAGGRDGTPWYYASMHALLQQRLPRSRLVRRLGEASRELTARAEADSSATSR